MKRPHEHELHTRIHVQMKREEFLHFPAMKNQRPPPHLGISDGNACQYSMQYYGIGMEKLRGVVLGYANCVDDRYGRREGVGVMRVRSKLSP